MQQFQLLPAIDIKDGRCVRLVRGEFDKKKEYTHDPVAQAKLFESQGAQYLHVVDLDGALEGNPKNYDLIKNIVESTRCNVEVSGGIRTFEHIEMYWKINPWQIILGSMAIFDLDFIKEVIRMYAADTFSISLDSKEGYAASRGWVDTSEVTIEDLAENLDAIGVKRYIFTDISRDGMLTGANLEATKQLKELVSGQVVASGGVKSLEEIIAIQQAGLDGVVVGKAIYEGAIDLTEAVSVVS